MKRGVLILNADDWGRDLRNTDCTLVCFEKGALSSVSAMVFMVDSERAAAIARERGIEAGLHLNLTTAFSAANCPPRLREGQLLLSRYLRRHRLAQIVFHPGLRKPFQYVVEAQVDEFRRLYGRAPERVDGHHHMHLCANVLWQRLLPAGTLVRRNFSFVPGEKGQWNVLYRRLVDGWLARRHRMTDFFFSLDPIEPVERLQKIFALAGQFSVAVAAHPVNPQEFAFLAEGGIFRQFPDIRIGKPSVLLERSSPRERGLSDSDTVRQWVSPFKSARPTSDIHKLETENHIAVCICTFKRPEMLSHLISKLQDQATDNLFTYSAVIVDNDLNRSAAQIVTDWQTKSNFPIHYHCEPEQNIALARNRAVENAKGNFIAFIDDDEFPESDWLLNLYQTLRRFNADAVLGPVRPHFPDSAPQWLIKSNLCERPSYKTGTILPGRVTRTGNVLLDRTMFETSSDRFDPAFGRTGGEDINFFTMMEKKGKVYVWCEEAPAYETVPPDRWSADFYIRKSSRIGTLAGARIRTRNPLFHSVYYFLKSVTYFAIAAIALAPARFFGKHIYMRVMTKVAYNLGLMSSLVGRSAIEREEERRRDHPGNQGNA